MKYAIGKYINFLDADDKWDTKSFRYIYFFFKFYKGVDIVAGRLKFFEAINSYHPLDYKFYKTRLVNLTEEYNCIHISGPSTFFKNSLISRQNFVKGIFSGEDTIFINNILLINPLIVFVKEAIYYYRRRSDSSSAVQTQGKKVDFYFSQITLVSQYLLDKSKKLYNQILPFIQFYIGYNVLFRILSPAFKYLNNSDYIKYCLKIIQLLKEIEDKYILEQKFTSSRLKILALSKKYNRDIRYELIFENECIIYSRYVLLNLKKNNNLITWRFLDIKDDILHLEAKDNFWMPKNKYFYYCKVGDKIYFPEYFEYSGYDFYTMFGLAEKGRVIIFNIPIESKKEICIQVFLNFIGTDIEIFPSFGYFTHIPTIINGCYVTKKYIIKIIDKRIMIYQYNKNLEKNCQKQCGFQLHNLKKDYIIELREKSVKYQILKKKNNKKETWIINDSQNKAGDNGEYFFRYLMNKNDNNLDIYFTINKSSTDFDRLKKFGNILDFGSKDHLFRFINADKIISSVSDSRMINPFGNDHKYIMDLIHFEVIYLQNRMINGDLSQSLNRINKNFSLFVTSSKKEYNFILSSNYGYNKNNVILTGFSRYDNLKELSTTINKEKMILLIPTWRNFISGTIDLVTHEIIYSDNFKNTTFFKFYNKFINDQKLISVLRKYNYSGIFCLHPFFSKQYLDFTPNNYFIVKDDCDYQELLSRASILITDYSSIFLDFAYLKKPILYIQFDLEEYKKYNLFDYFHFEKENFGPICYEINCMINEIIKEILNDCKVANKYLKNIRKFFAFSDNNNNDRIYLEITKKTKHEDSNSIILLIFPIIIFLRFILVKLKMK